MKNLLCLLTCIFCFEISFAHIAIKGKIVDSRTDEPVPGANVAIKNSSQGVTTDLEGNFTLISDSASITLIISHVGFETQEISVDAPADELIIRLRSSAVNIAQITVNGLDASNLKSITKVDVNLRQTNSSQDILRMVPGLFIAQHAGGGKAEQIFLRGFDIDHGTDIEITADGMPVNMVSHAHGQGYADLHFLTPELVRAIDFGKGPYYASHGNFATAGYVDFQTLNRLDKSMVKLEAGMFNTYRILAMTDLLGRTKLRDEQSAYLSFDYKMTDGAFDSPQSFNRVNVFGKYHGRIGSNTTLTFQTSYFTSKWDASGQIPARAVESGMISRFGAIDDTEGGQTSRANIMAQIANPLGKGSIRNQLYYSKYDFELYSNFTFFLNDSLNGDQIRQKESRNIFGYKSQYSVKHTRGGAIFNTSVGGGLRYDASDDNELSHTKNRVETLEQIQFGDVDEANLFLFANEEFNFGKLIINPAVRLDYFRFEYLSRLNQPENKRGAEQKIFASPKLNVLYNVRPNVQLYVKSGIGFHSNDSRGVVAQNGNEILPPAYGADLGIIVKPFKNLLVNVAGWILYLEQEFVYVGDAGIVEPSGKTIRKGVDFSLRCQITDWLYADFDLNYTHARAIGEESGENYIPLAPDLTSTGGLTFKHKTGINGSLRYRYIKDRPANEDNSVTAEGYVVMDAQLNYTRKKFEIGLSVENLLNTEWNEAQFDTESRLKDEPEPVSELHFTPGTPLFVKGSLAFFF